MEIISQNFSLLGFAVSEELGNIQTDRQTHSITHSLTDWCFDREIRISSHEPTYIRSADCYTQERELIHRTECIKRSLSITKTKYDMFKQIYI